MAEPLPSSSNNLKPNLNMGHVDRLAQPLHIQRLERHLTLTPFLNEVERVFSRRDEIEGDAELRRMALATTREERRADKLRLYNFTNVHGPRTGLQDLLISDTSSDDDDNQIITEDYFQHILRTHYLEKKLRHKYTSNPQKYRQYQYYGAGLLSNYDKFPEHQMGIIGGNGGPKKDSSIFDQKEYKAIEFMRISRKHKRPSRKESIFNDSFDDLELEDRLLVDEDDDDPSETSSKPARSSKFLSATSKHHHLKRNSKSDGKSCKSAEVMALRRRKLWTLMSKKEVAKGQRIKSNNHKEMVTARRKVAQMCTKHWKQRALQSQKNMKETVWRCKRLAREMQAYWKRYERVERDARRKQEKEAEEQRKHDVEFMEAKRQQRKLNFLITQTELFAHFYSKKAAGSNEAVSDNTAARILSQLDEQTTPRLLALDEGYDSEEMKWRATQHAQAAFDADLRRTSEFDVRAAASAAVGDGSSDRNKEPLFRGQLKHYQLKGVQWLANLYDQGINGILADEMGLGKTVQSIAFLCQIAEKYSVWGPFLIISPASTLHNWQQEMQRFVPDFKVVPYWGNVQERKILRQFWDPKNLHTQSASFHVVITSYQLIIADFKYFNRIKWQYLILDEAQAIKSSNSMRWKLLLGFSCRNRLLLSGTPIQNSMAELWALLHFIMPTLFDNHDEFNEWFSKDIESQAENKSKMDEKHLSRLHMILKPFMLRRIKKDVENELSDKIEIMVYCPLTLRQKLLYSGLKQKIRIEDLLAGISGRAGTAGDEPGKNVTSSLMNLVMQFRKVCNHPELFERREPKSPYFIDCPSFVVPKLVFEYGFLHRAIPSFRHITHNALSIFSVQNIQRSFTFLRLIGLSTQEAHDLFLSGILYFLMSLSAWRELEFRINHTSTWHPQKKLKYPILLTPNLPLSVPNLHNSLHLNNLLFTKTVGSSFYTFRHHTYYSMPETLEHRIMRSKKIKGLTDLPLEKKLDETILTSDSRQTTPRKSGKNHKSPSKSSPVVPSNEDQPDNSFILPEFLHVDRPPIIREFEPTDMPLFLYRPILKVQSKSRELYASCRNCAWERLKHMLCANANGYHTVWFGHPNLAESRRQPNSYFHSPPVGGMEMAKPHFGWSNIVIPDKHTLVADAGKLYVLDGLLKRLKEGGHRVLIYSQMTRMIDLLEEYMWHRKHTYMRLDGSSKISERRDMVDDFQNRADIFVFLLSTRAGGLGINLTAADTVIFYDSDWNPTVDQQAMDRAHRLGQTKQVTVYRLICKGTIEERILQRAREKSEIQRMVISGGNFKPDHLKPKEVVSLLLDDDEIEKKYIQRQAEKKISDELKSDVGSVKRKNTDVLLPALPSKKIHQDEKGTADESIDSSTFVEPPQSPTRSEFSTPQDDTSNDGLVIDVDGPMGFPSPGLNSSPLNPLGIGSLRVKPVVRGTRRGRPPGPRRGAINLVRKRSYDADIKVPAEMLIPEGGAGTADVSCHQRGVKRGPGRPRMKPYDPASRGSRGTIRTRKAPAPLQVPLARCSTTSTTTPTHDSSRSYGFYGSSE